MHYDYTLHDINERLSFDPLAFNFRISSLTSHLLLVIVAVVVDTAVEPVASYHPLLLHQTLETVLGPTVRITHHLDQAGHNAAHVPVLCLYNIKTGAHSFYINLLQTLLEMWQCL